MSVRAPERTGGAHRRGGRRARRKVASAPQFGFTAPAPVVRTRVERRRSRRRRARFGAVVSYVLGFAMVGSALWYAHSRLQVHEASVQPGPPPVSSLIAWSLRTADRSYGAVIAIPPGRPAVAVAVPADTLVDLPGGSPTTVGAAGDSPGSLVAALQATFNQRIPHYLFSQAADYQNLLRLHPNSCDIREGGTTLSGEAAIEYLQSAPPEEVTGRWEDVLAATLTVVGDPGVRTWPFGATDDVTLVPSLLAHAKGAPVVELPTAPADGGGLQVDTRGLKSLRLLRFPDIGGRLVRVVVLNGNGQPGIGAQLSTRLAPAGYRVVASQNLSTFDTKESQVIASNRDFLGSADEVRGLLGVGRVYVGPQSTGIADITIVVGKDYSQA